MGRLSTKIITDRRIGYKCEISRSLIDNSAPWFLPRPALSMLATCDPWQSTRFLQEVTSTDQAQCGHCLSDCDDVKYSVTATSTKLE